ncbi:MAG: HNH endonuclease [Candidatus Binatia bacterium]
MRDEIISWIEVQSREGVALQKGMHYRVKRDYSILLMSQRKNAPYRDEIDEERGLLIYEGHDVPTKGNIDPKAIDQPLTSLSGSLTENGKFYRAIEEFKKGSCPAEHVKVYEKIAVGIWSDKGFFELVDGKFEFDGKRHVFKFFLRPLHQRSETEFVEIPHLRLIPTFIKVEVWGRDRGRCVLCGATDNLHFDHDIAFSRGGSSMAAANIRLLCARHNLQKSDKILSLLPYLFLILR